MKFDPEYIGVGRIGSALILAQVVRLDDYVFAQGDLHTCRPPVTDPRVKAGVIKHFRVDEGSKYVSPSEEISLQLQPVPVSD